MEVAMFRRTASEKDTVSFLDRAVPLDGASHAEVIKYSVDIPLRYAQCFATLADGRTVRLQNSSQFVGWSGWEADRSILFSHGRRRIEIKTNADLPTGRVLSWLSLMIGSDHFPARNHSTQKFIARDGSQIVIRRCGRALVKYCKGFSDRFMDRWLSPERAIATFSKIDTI
jgi:hypothetical protein